MPYDGTDAPNLEALDKIDEAIDLIGKPGQWCKGSERNKAGQYCIRGALIAVDGLEMLEIPVLRAIHQVAGTKFRRIEEFNDYVRTTHAQVLCVLYRARDNLTAGEIVPEKPIPVGMQAWVSAAALWVQQHFGSQDTPPALKSSVIPPQFLRPEHEFLAGELQPAETKTPELVD